jgi:hypothetical protein
LKIGNWNLVEFERLRSGQTFHIFNAVFWFIISKLVLAKPCLSNICQHAQRSACCTPSRALHATLAAGGGMPGLARFFKQAAARQCPWH